MHYNELLHGGDYNPEQWLKYPDILEKDIEYLKLAKCNEVTLGVFSWSTLEPEEGVFHLDWLEDIIHKLFQNNIKVILATPSGARPQWLATKYPEVLRTNESRVKQLYGTRHNHCYTSPVYREKVAIINQKLASRFAKHPGVIMWHISNELGGECHCELCQAAFKGWVREKYHNDIQELNEKWSTTFWSHTYNNFEQVESPSSIGENALHGLNLDWKRFVTDQTIDFVKNEIECIKKFNPEAVITTNMMYYYNGLNYSKFKDMIDVASWDSYPTWHKQEDWLTGMDNGMYHDYIRSIKKQPFLLMESSPGTTNWQKVSKLKKPGMNELSALQAIAHGSDSVLYFQWRQSMGASEKFHGAVIDHYGGTDTRVFKEVTKTGEALDKLKEVCHTRVVSKVAIIYDQENRWALEDSRGPRNCGLYYKETVQKYYTAFRKAGMNVDIIDMEAELDEYDVVVAPMLYLFRANIEDKLENFVHKGKIACIGYWTGIVDEYDRCFLEGTPHGLMEVLGLRATEIDGLYDHEENRLIPVENNELSFSKSYSCKNLCELVSVTTAVAIMNYGSDFYKDTPVVTVNHYGKGKAYYIGTDACQEFYDDFILQMIGRNNIIRDVDIQIPSGVEACVRYGEGQKFIFLQNFNAFPVQIQLPQEWDRPLFGKSNGKLEAYETVVFQEEV